MEEKQIEEEPAREPAQEPAQDPADEAVERTKRENAIGRFSATRIAYVALFTALAFAVTFLEFPLFPAAPWFELDFANVFFLIEGFIFGPVEAVVSVTVKELLCLTKSSSAFVGEAANWLTSVAYILIPSVAYRFRKGRWWVALYMLFGCLLQIAVSLPANRFITYPLYMGEGAAEVFRSTWYFALAFNAVKGAAVSLVVFLVYKPLSRLIKATNRRFRAKKRDRSAGTPRSAA